MTSPCACICMRMSAVTPRFPAPCWVTAFLGSRQWHRNQDSEMVAVDSTYIIRNTTQCPNKMGAQAYRTGMMPGLTMSTATA